MKDLTKIEIGEFKVNATVIRVTDPCYDPKTTPDRCFTKVYGMKKGTYECYAMQSDEGSWGKRIAELHIRLKGSNPLGERYVGGACVDSGQCGFFLANKFRKIYEGEDHGEAFYEKACEITLDADRNRCGIIDGVGVLSESGYGDGMYGVYAEIDENKDVVGLILEFIDADEDDEEDW